MSFEEFVQGCSPRLFRTALLLAGQDRAAAEDLLQLALERANRHWGRVCRSGDPERYVRRILANAANDRWRRALRRPERPLDPGDRGPVADDQVDVVVERDFLIRALAGPPGNLIEAVRRRHRQHLRRVAVAGIASAVVAVSAAAALPAGIGAAGHGRAGQHRRAASTVYVEFQQKLTGLIVPISAATNRPAQPIRVGGSMALAPDGKTLYASPGAVTIPVSTATNKPGKPIRLPYGFPGGILTAP